MSRLEQLLKLHAADPKDPFCTYGIALEHSKAGRHDEAIHWLDQTIQSDPRYCYAYFQKAKVLIDIGKGDDARRVLEAGLTAAGEAKDAHAREEIAALLETLD